MRYACGAHDRHHRQSGYIVIGVVQMSSHTIGSRLFLRANNVSKRGVRQRAGLPGVAAGICGWRARACRARAEPGPNESREGGFLERGKDCCLALLRATESTTCPHGTMFGEDGRAAASTPAAAGGLRRRPPGCNCPPTSSVARGRRIPTAISNAGTGACARGTQVIFGDIAATGTASGTSACRRTMGSPRSCRCGGTPAALAREFIARGGEARS